MFLDKVLTNHFVASFNKVVAIQELNTWFWVSVLGQGGEMHGKPKMFRHTMPDGGTPFWTLRQVEGWQGKYRKYELVPFKGPFVCRYSGRSFDRYEGQLQFNVSQPYQILEDERARLAALLNGRGELEGNSTETGFGRFLWAELEKVEELLECRDVVLADVEEYVSRDRDADLLVIASFDGQHPQSFAQIMEWAKGGETPAIAMHAIAMLAFNRFGICLSEGEERRVYGNGPRTGDFSAEGFENRLRDAVLKNRGVTLEEVRGGVS